MKLATNPLQCAKYDRSQVTIRDPDNKQATWIITKTLSGHDKHKIFCSQCGCTMWTIPMNHGGEKMIVRTSLVDEG